jgi:hypothetical protein
VEALASNDRNELKSAARLVVPGSPAAIYVQHQANLAEADVDGGESPAPEEVSGNGRRFQLCVTDHHCDTFARFEQDGSGRVASFRVNGFDIAPRLRRGDGVAVRVAGAKFTFLTSYRPATRASIEYFVVRVDSGEKPLLMNVSTMKYRDPSGKWGYSSNWGGPRMLDAHSSALIYGAFRGIRPGGGIMLDGCLDGCIRRYKVKIKT